MTVEAITRKAGPYDFTSGGQYPFYFKVFAQTDVYVIVTDADGVETQINADTDYTVTLNDNQDNDAGGYVTLLQDYTGNKITIGSDVPYTQEVIITNKGGFYPDTLNKAYDKLTILCQQNREILDRALKVGISSSVSADEYKGELEGLVNQSVASAASAAASAQQAATDSAQAVSDSATALSQSTTALTQSGTALSQSTTALSQSTDAVNSIHPALEAAQQASSDAAEAVTKSEQALAETAAIDSKVEQAVNDAIAGVTIPGLTPETIAGALGYVPYDGETNALDFATNAEVAGAIAAIPEQVNADWNATEGAAAILNKPTLSAVATSGNYADLQNKPATMTGATAEAAGTSGFVPAPSAGDENKVLKGDGTWGTIASRNIGETVFSLLPLSDAGLHLLDGSLLPVGGIYNEAITKIAALQSSNPNLFTTEENWQSSVSSYGVCGKFVYVEGVSLRLPKITGFVEGTLDSGALGDLVEAGLPNIEDIYYSYDSNSYVVSNKGLFYNTTVNSHTIGAYSATAATTNSTAFDASKVNNIYGNSDTVQPQSIKGYLYIVLATSTKTDVQVNIDNVVTELNGKAGTDLANINSEGKNVIANLGNPSIASIHLTATHEGTYIAPADGYLYFALGPSVSNGVIYGQIRNNTTSLRRQISFQSDPNGWWCDYIEVRKGDEFFLSFNPTTLTGTDLYFVYSEGSKPQ